jgi:hypothetical protein
MKQNFTKKFAITLCLAASVLYSCKKQDLVGPTISLNTQEVSQANMMAFVGAPTPPLDWENISFMPVPPNTNPIPVPWQGGLGGAKMDDDIIFDYASANGWSLVYNTFTTTANYNPKYFMLYNKYRGLLRIYFYIAPGGNYPSSNIAHLLNISGSRGPNSPILNFAGQEIIDFNTKSQNVGQIQPYKVSSTESWYAAEFEIAYDALANTTPFEQLRLNWQIDPNSISNISLNGLQTGDISGTLQSNTSSPNFFANSLNGVLDAGLKLGSSKAAANVSFLTKPVATAILNAATNGISGIVKGFLSGLIGGANTGTTDQKINLKINTKISTTGTSTQGSQLFANVFSIPGTQNVNNTLPFYPSYANPLGVFYISAKPIVKRTVNSTLINDETGVNYLVDQRYTLDENSYQMVYNSSLTNVANITNLKKEVVMFNVPTNISGLNRIGGDPEQVGDRIIYSGAMTGIERTAPRPLTVTVSLAVRISFDVVPKDGSPKTKIIKTFLATQG